MPHALEGLQCKDWAILRHLRPKISACYYKSRDIYILATQIQAMSIIQDAQVFLCVLSCIAASPLFLELFQI